MRASERENAFVLTHTSLIGFSGCVMGAQISFGNCSCVHKKTKKSKECALIREICKKVLEQPGKKINPSNASLYPFSMEAGHQ